MKLSNEIGADQRGHLAQLAFYESWTFVPRSRQSRSLPVAIVHPHLHDVDLLRRELLHRLPYFRRAGHPIRRGRASGLGRRKAAARREEARRARDRLGANLFFQLVSRRYERGSILITSNQSLAGWGQVFGDQVIATAILDRLSADGYDLVGGVGQYEGIWRMASVRGPEGFIVNLAQRID